MRYKFCDYNFLLVDLTNKLEHKISSIILQNSCYIVHQSVIRLLLLPPFQKFQYKLFFLFTMPPPIHLQRHSSQTEMFAPFTLPLVNKEAIAPTAWSWPSIEEDGLRSVAEREALTAINSFPATIFYLYLSTSNGRDPRLTTRSLLI